MTQKALCCRLHIQVFCFCFLSHKVGKVLYPSLGQSCNVQLFACCDSDSFSTKKKLQYFILSMVLLRTTESGQEVRRQSQRLAGMFSCVASKTFRTWPRKSTDHTQLQNFTGLRVTNQTRPGIQRFHECWVNSECVCGVDVWQNNQIEPNPSKLPSSLNFNIS